MRHTPKTVLMVHPDAELFGVGRMLLQSVVALREAGWRVVVALPVNGPLVAELRRCGASILIVPMLVLRRPLLRPRGWPTLLRSALFGQLGAWRLLRRVRPDAVYISTVRLPQWPVLARSRGLWAVSHLHGSVRPGRRWMERLLHLPHLASQRVLVTSRLSLETIRIALPALARRAEFVHDGVASPSRPQLPREPLELPLRLLYIGRFTPREGPELVLEAASRVQRSGHPVSITLLATSSEEAPWSLQQLRERTGTNDIEVVFAGFQDDVWPHLAEADMLLGPSHEDEPFGNIVIEGILALRPVITNDSSMLRDSFGSYPTLRLTPPGDARAIADAVISVLESWSAVVVALSESREIALERHSPQTYRTAIARACAPGHGARSSSRT